jgi:hypothetical protein
MGRAFVMLEQNNGTIIYRRYGRTIVLERLDYGTRYSKLLAFGFRPSFAAVLAARPIVEMDELLEFAVEFGLIER